MAARNCLVPVHFSVGLVVLISEVSHKPTSGVLHLARSTKRASTVFAGLFNTRTGTEICTEHPHLLLKKRNKTSFDVPIVEYIHWFGYFFFFFDCPPFDLWRSSAFQCRLHAQPWPIVQWQRWRHIWIRSSGPLAGRTAAPCVLQSVQLHLHPEGLCCHSAHAAPCLRLCVIFARCSTRRAAFDGAHDLPTHWVRHTAGETSFQHIVPLVKAGLSPYQLWTRRGGTDGAQRRRQEGMGRAQLLRQVARTAARTRNTRDTCGPCASPRW